MDEVAAGVAVVAAAAAAAFANLSTLSASFICRAGILGMLRNWKSVDELRLGGLDQDPDPAEWEVYGDSSERELLREGIDSGCK